MTGSLNIARRLSFLFLLFAAFHVFIHVNRAEGEEKVAAFKIKTFEISGNSLFTTDKLREIIKAFTGNKKTAEDVEKARDTLEKFYHDSGYPAVLVNIPEQTVKDGVVKLQVIESRIGRVKISGNRYFTSEKMMKDLSSFNSGEILYLPKVQEEISRLNRNQDFKVEPVMTPGKEPGMIDVELKVEDHMPLHASLELNNRCSPDTESLRLNGIFHYDNLWQKEHSLTLQYQTAPQNSNEVQAVSASYILPAPWEKDHQWILFGMWSDSDVAFGEDFAMIGKGNIFGTRYVIPLPPYKLYAHNVTLGLDYKSFKTNLNMGASTGEIDTPVTYMPLSLAYGSVLQDSWGGMTQFSAAMNVSFRGIVSNQREFDNDSYKGRADYLYFTAGVQRDQKLPLDMGLMIKVDGQISDQSLISNEKYAAGGMESVRGYKESESLGDNAVHSKVELSFPDPLGKSGIGKRLQITPYIFYDFALLTEIDPASGQTSSYRLEGTGAGVRGTLTKYLEYEADWAVALNDTDQTKSGTNMFYFKIKALF
ncbi:MAG TPA: ShlB/FhaC/HecB family hemolysin secretion/activation protein [Smithella sp.]|nr:ShlB/FhaC/HecB family hemolysin secretion/activation protein [Smithella sp.]